MNAPASLAAAIAASLILLAHSAAAQDATTLDGVRVTGSKRDTPYLKSDLSVTVLDRQALKEAGVVDFRDLDKLAPNVKFNAMGQLSDMFISIRGIESNPFLVNRASVYIDGIPFRELSNAVLNQVESVEVLRGPQGTLYGANSESGLVLVRTRGPSDTPEGELTLRSTWFGNGNGNSLDGFLAGPLRPGGDLSGSVAFMASDDDSYLRNLTPFGGTRGQVGEGYLQGKLRWRPSDYVIVNALAYHLRTRAPGMFEYEYLPLDVGLYNRTYGEALNGGRRAGDFTYINDAPKRTENDESVAGASAQWQLATGTVDLATSYRTQEDTSAGYDFDMTQSAALAGRIHDEQTAWNAEARFSSLDDRPFTWMAGVSTYRTHKDSVLGTFVGPITRGLDSYHLAPRQTAKGEDYSAFATASYRLPTLPELTASVGLRHEQARRSTEQRAGSLDLAAGGVVRYRDAALAHTFSATLPRVSLRYDASEDLAFYAASAKGYIPGGFNLAAAQSDVINAKVLRYESEMMWSHELGFKMNIGAGRGHVGGAVFHITSDNWQEIQLAVDADGRPISSDYVGSDASIRSRGAELEGAYAITPALTLTANAGYVDAKYTALQASANENLAGNRVKLTPHYTGYVAARYQHPSGLFARVESAFTGSSALDERNRAFQPAVAILGVQVGYVHGPWSTRVFVQNLTDKRRINGLIFDNLAFGRDGNYYGPIDNPRIIGAEISYTL
ncbi:MULTISPECIES: TonB-dependent receptor [unclassified Stenotrophomonas]|uniref:TonB-dependent receptor n=1 Tax=unclassified Stenotrophomonas TaxID=196198 RepID=UPI002017D40B|nr:MULTISPECIES: TonB-dependent receptor [unclassified Stenotrophomonas]